ncbi:hypothetical protein D3Z30_13635, partial [Staphylococcus warneri]|nr:hypothetical protein [Staphylococcus warneri]
PGVKIQQPIIQAFHLSTMQGHKSIVFLQITTHETDLTFTAQHKNGSRQHPTNLPGYAYLLQQATRLVL